MGTLYSPVGAVCGLVESTFVGVFSCLPVHIPTFRLVVEWARGIEDVHSSRPDGTYHGGSGAYLTLFMWSPVGGLSLGEKGVHDKTPY